MRVSHITLKSKIHLLNYSGIWYTARHPHITEKYWSYMVPGFAPPAKNPAGAPGCNTVIEVIIVTFVLAEYN